MALPDPKSFTTLEEAQAELARVYGILDTFFVGVKPLMGEIAQARADIAKLLNEERV